MSIFFRSDRFGNPQVIAAFLLLVFIVQCMWLVSRDTRRGMPRDDEVFRIEAGLREWGGLSHASGTGEAGDSLQAYQGEIDPRFDRDHSRLYYLISAAPFLVWPGRLQSDTFSYWGWLARAPYMFFGLVLGASLWYVARRLYGNNGGYIALTLYCFAPGMIRCSSLWFREPETGAAWGAFGAVFTAVAVAHTLYAPREVVLWNWRRIVLLGISLALAVGSQYSLAILLAIVLAILLYLAPTRRRAAAVIWLASSALAFVILLAGYFFHWQDFAQSLRQAAFFPMSAQALHMPRLYLEVLEEMVQNCPALLFALPVCLIVYLRWRRTRYFGNTAPLLIGAMFLVLGALTPHYPGLGFRIVAVPFLLLFVAGILSDLLEVEQRSLIRACIWGLLGAYAAWSLMEIARVKV